MASINVDIETEPLIDIVANQTSPQQYDTLSAENKRIDDTVVIPSQSNNANNTSHPNPSSNTLVYTTPIENAYEMARSSKKIGTLATIIFILKTSCSIGIFTSQYGFGEAGYVLSTVITILVWYMMIYGFLTIGKLCNQIEYEQGHNFKVSAYHVLGEYCSTDRWKSFVKVIIIVAISSLNVVTVVTLLANITTYIYLNIWEVDTRYIKLCMLIWTVIVLFVMLEPEKYKFVAIPAFCIILCIYLICSVKVGIVISTDYDDTIKNKSFHFENTFLCIGIQLYLFSGVGIIVNIRNTMKYPQKFPKCVVWSYSIVFILIVTTGLLCYTAFGD